MRAIILSVIIFGSIPFILMRPYIGLLVYSWISFMSPHRMAYGFADHIPWAMLIGGIFIFSWLISKEPKLPPLTPIVVLTIMFILWMCVTSVFSFKAQYGQDGHWFWLERVLKIMIVVVITMVLLTDRKRIDGYIWVMVISIGFYAIRGGIFTLMYGGLYRVYGPMASMIQENNGLGVATVMIVPLVRYLHLQATNKHIRRGLLAAIPLLILSAIGSYSRGGLLALSAMGVYMFFKSRHKTAAGIVIFVLMIVALSFAPQKWYDRMATIQHYEKDESALTRLNAWGTVIGMVLDRPILGGGFRALVHIPQVWEKYAPDPNMRAVAHSIYFQTLGEHGFPGLIMFVSVLILAYRNGGWLIRSARDRPDLRWAHDLGSMFQVALIGYAVGGAFLDLAYYDLYWGMVAVLVCARVIVSKELAKPVKAPHADTPAAPASAIAAAPRKTYLRGPGKVPGHSGFLRG